jgi:hypothetical protein
MTKPKETPKTNWKESKTKSSKYTTFYLILLIFTTISAVFGLTSFSTIGDSLRYIDSSPVLTCITLGQYISALLTIAGVVYLYKKRKEGLYLLFGAYAFTIITMVVLPFVSDPVVIEAAKQVTLQEGGRISMQDAETFARIGLNIVAAINGISSIIFALLWQLAWNKQAKRDSSLTKTSE